MQFLSLQPFVPSGSNVEGAKEFFQQLGFHISWDAGDYTGFEKDGCKFILQNYANKEFVCQIEFMVFGLWYKSFNFIMYFDLSY